MHTYRKVDLGWQAGFYLPNSANWMALGPIVEHEWEAAALASFLNGGRYNPYEIEAVFRADPAPEDEDEDADTVHPDRPKALEDYPIERARK